MYNDANRTGIILKVSLIVLFVIYIVFMFISHHRQNKKLLTENSDMNYIIHSIPQIFDVFIVIDLENNTYRYMTGSKPSKFNISSSGDYNILADKIIETVSDESIKQHMSSFLDPEIMKVKLVNADFTGKRILVVEYNELNREIVCEILKEHGLVMEKAENGAEAVEMVKRSEPGYENQSLENKELAAVPIIAMTANAFDETGKSALSLE